MKNCEMPGILSNSNRWLAALILLAITAVTMAGCAHYTPDEEAYYRDVRCKWVLWSADMPGQADCQYLLRKTE
ncbi:MAG: hypothetical protein H6970_01145 [Gammaproteobacteria bacterium]|nr:hypothetical protein [Gammaproteobacteria bacterium]MCP5423663.1 hypothetical protein [Gammaproteobacteria bacterium]